MSNRKEIEAKKKEIEGWPDQRAQKAFLRIGEAARKDLKESEETDRDALALIECLEQEIADYES